MKLSQYTKQQGISYRTALRWFRSGTIQGYQAPTGTISVQDEKPALMSQKVAVYARVSSAEHRAHLERQAERLSPYCEVKGDQVGQVVKEIASGVNDSRPKLLGLLKDMSMTLIVVEHRDRLTRFGFHSIEVLLETQGRHVEVVNGAENDKEDLIADLVASVESFTARLYGQRRAKRKTEALVEQLKSEDKEMQLVEQHIMSKSDPRYEAIDRAAFASKNLYNLANYHMRQSFIHQGKYLGYASVYHLVKGEPAYQALPRKVSNDILRLLDKNWKAYRKALKAYYEATSQFLGHPCLPKYKDKANGRNILISDIQALSKKGLKRGLVQPSQLGITIQTKHTNGEQARIIPRKGYSVVEVVYERKEIQASVNPSLMASIDIGVNNLAALTSNKIGFIPRLVNGRPLKSTNQYYVRPVQPKLAG